MALGVCSLSYGASIPWTAELENALSGSNVVVSKAAPVGYNVDGNHVKKVARFTWSSAILGTSTASKGLGVHLPAKSVLTDSYVYIKTVPVRSGTSGLSTIAFKCEDSANIFAATALDTYSIGNVVSGVNYGADSSGAANMTTSIASDCEITVTLGSPFSAGEVTGFVEYVQGE
jgi:hypothetical protein